MKTCGAKKIALGVLLWAGTLSVSIGQVIDKYGQYIPENWDGKVTSDAQLQNEYHSEDSALAAVALNANVFDQYGGIKDGDNRTAKGFFRAEKINGIWWLITPEGHKYILKGVDGCFFWYSAADVSDPSKFEELPDKTLYPDAWSLGWNDGHSVNFYALNCAKKYGGNWRTKWEDLIKRRFLDWGFNSSSKWSAIEPNVPLPYTKGIFWTANIQLTKNPWAEDPYGPNFQVCVENAASSAAIANLKDDKMLVGYYVQNENGWNDNTFQTVLAADNTLPAKCAFIDFELSRHNNDLGTLNSLFGTSAASTDALKDVSINAGSVPGDDKSAFIQNASKQFYSKAHAAIMKFDPNHMFLGSCPIVGWSCNLDWAIGGFPYVDVWGYDYYRGGVPSEYQSFDKPMMNLEYSLTYADHGLNDATSIGSPKCSSWDDRGTQYDAYVSAAFSNPNCVGMGWFMFMDWLPTNPSGAGGTQWGIINITDQPYYGLLYTAKQTNIKVWDLHSKQDLSSIITGTPPPTFTRPSFSHIVGSGSVPVTLYDLRGERLGEFADKASAIRDLQLRHCGGIGIVVAAAKSRSSGVRAAKLILGP
jgi:hypothetical protein